MDRSAILNDPFGVTEKIERKSLLKKAFAILERGDHAAFLAALDQVAGQFGDPATIKFVGAVRQQYYRGLNSLFDSLDDFLGRDFSSLIPSRRDEFDSHTSIKGHDYAQKYHAYAMSYVDIHTSASGLTPESRVLEIGCGAGNFAYALSHVLKAGCYFGVDTSATNIASCAARFAQHPMFKFHHVAAALDSYHFLLEQDSAAGAPAVESLELPLLDSFYTLQVSHSVFTHMYTEQVRNYLKQIFASLAPGGVATNTCFIIDRHSREQISLGKATHPFKYEKDGFYWYWPHDPLMGNAFALELLLGLYEEAGFQIESPILFGTWANRPGPFYQDIVVARKPR